jgi:hypothetical protein
MMRSPQTPRDQVERYNRRPIGLSCGSLETPLPVIVVMPANPPLPGHGFPGHALPDPLGGPWAALPGSLAGAAALGPLGGQQNLAEQLDQNPGAAERDRDRTPRRRRGDDDYPHMFHVLCGRHYMEALYYSLLYLGSTAAAALPPNALAPSTLT